MPVVMQLISVSGTGNSGCHYKLLIEPEALDMVQPVKAQEGGKKNGIKNPENRS
jgi:hypothetical protein